MNEKSDGMNAVDEKGARVRVLVMVPNWLGDCVMAWPVFDALEGSGFELVIAARRNIAPLFDAVENSWKVIRAPQGGLRGLLEAGLFAGEVQESAPQIAVLLPNTYSSAFHAWCTGAPMRVGAAFRPLRAVFLTRSVEKARYTSYAHQAQRYLSILEALGMDCVRPPQELAVRLKPSAKATGAAATLGLPAKYAVIAPEAAYGPAKEWPAERFAETAGLLVRDGWPVVVVGKGGGGEGGEGSERSRALLSVSGVINLVGKTDLAGLVGVFAGAGLFVGNDSGAAHLAAGLGVPSVVIFGSTDPGFTRPLGSKVRVLWGRTECSPCFSRRCLYNTYDCLKKVTVGEVMKAAGEALAK